MGAGREGEGLVNSGGIMAKVEIDIERCKGCELCIAACPCKVLAISDAFNSSGYYPCIVAHPEKCTGCAFCALVCPDMAIEVFREVKEAGKEAKKKD